MILALDVGSFMLGALVAVVVGIGFLAVLAVVLKARFMPKLPTFPTTPPAGDEDPPTRRRRGSALD